jgi:uncharacterized repeat protein (TIGR01451 family)
VSADQHHVVARAAAARRTRLTAGSVVMTLLATFLAVIAIALPTAAPAAAAAGDTNGCGFAPDGSGTYADTICWIDLAGYNDTEARSAAGQSYTLQIGDYTVTFTAHTSDVAGTDTPGGIVAAGTPTWADGALGNAKYAGSYHGIPGKPAWLIQENGQNPTNGNTVGAQLTLSNIVVTDPSGAAVTNYAFIFGEAESSSQNEQTTWQSDKSISFLQTINPSADRGCDQAVLTGLGTDSVSCPGRGPDGPGDWSSVLLRTNAPTTVSQAIVTTSNNASAFGIMVSRLELNKTVAGRIAPSDSFDLSVSTPEGGQLATASTGTGDSASTGSVLVLPRNDRQGFTLGEAATPGSGTDLSQYNQSWSCTRNGDPDPDLSATNVASQSVAPAVGDFIDCTITNTAPPALSCQPGTIYALGGDGTLVSIPTDSIDSGSATSARIGTMAPASNDLAITSGGGAAYAFSRSTDQVAKYSSGGGVQTFDDPAPGEASQAFGGVDPVNGIYYFGGNNPDGTITLFGWDTTTDTPVGDGGPVATISLPAGQTSTTGDLAFDALGNLYFTAADGLYRVDGTVPSTADDTALSSTRVATLPTPDGDSYGAIAFASNGYLYIGSGGGSSNHWLKVNPNTGETVATSVAGASSAQDFASCQFPSTLQAEKNVVGRQADSDQFTLSITGDGVNAGNTATTAGTADGVQPQIAGPVLAVGGSTYTVAETAAGTSVLDEYTTTYSCVDTRNGDAVVTSGTGTSFDLTMDANPDEMGIVCTFTNDPIAPSYTVTKTASETTALPGDMVNYTVTVTNTGPVPYTADNPASFTDDLTGVLDDAAYNGDAAASASGGGNAPAPSYTAPTLSWSGPLAPAGSDGDTVTITYSVTVNRPDTGDYKLVNAASPPAGSGGGCGAAASAPPCDPVTVPVQSYTVTKAISTPAASVQLHPGDKVTYTVTVTNVGQVAYTADAPASFTDDLSKVLDDATYNGDAAASGGTGLPTPSYTAPTLSWSGPLAVGETVTVTYSVTVDSPDPGNDLLDNAASPPDDNGGGCGAADTAPPCAPVDAPVQSYSVTKTASTAVTHPGDTVTYRITLKNTGTADYTAADPAGVTDDLSKVLDDATYNGDAAASGGTGLPRPSYTAPTLSWSGPLPVGKTVTITYSVTVNTPDSGDGKLINAASPPPGDNGGGCGTDLSAPPCDPITVPVQAYSVTKTASATAADPGDKITYKIAVKNTGQVAYTADAPASFSDDLSKVLDDASYDDDADNGATYQAPTLSWSGPLAVGKTVTITYTVTVNAPDSGDHELSNAATPTGPGGACAAGAATPCPQVEVPVRDLHLVKKADRAQVAPGDVITYTITGTDTGKAAFTVADPAMFTDDLTGVLDDAAYDNDAKADLPGTLGYTAPDLSWSGPLAAGQSVTVTYTVKVDDPDNGDGKLHNVVSTPTDPSGVTLSNCPAGSTDPDCFADSAVSASSTTPDTSTPTNLASTGNDTALQLAAGAFLLLVGAALSLAGIRRRRRLS